MTPNVIEARQLSGEALAAALRDSRAQTWALVADLTPAQWLPTLQDGVNPIAWELAHLAWFAEFWVLRGPHDRAADGQAKAYHAPRFAGPDAYFDSSRLPHAARWTTPMPTRPQLTQMLEDQLEACLEALPGAAEKVRATSARGAKADSSLAYPGASLSSTAADEALYFHRLALFHEDMHGEAFCWLRAALGYSAPGGMAVPQVPSRVPMVVPGGERQIGFGANATGFAFDNERPGPSITVPDFEIDSAPVTALEFARFVDAGGYDEPRYWPLDAGVWRTKSRRNYPQHWRRDPRAGTRGEWQTRWFDRWLALAPALPAMHLNAFEAEAYCLWAGRRLPTAVEWEHAAKQAAPQLKSPAVSNKPSFQWGHSVWEWTADAFKPYPGFAPGPYREYSAPWFGDHRELRGGAFATHERLHSPQYRNFFQPHRTDVFSGFRTAAR